MLYIQFYLRKLAGSKAWEKVYGYPKSDGSNVNNRFNLMSALEQFKCKSTKNLFVL